MRVLVESIGLDIRYTCRSVLRTPGIAITAILTFVYLSVVAERRVVAAIGAARTLEPT